MADAAAETTWAVPSAPFRRPSSVFRLPSSRKGLVKAPALRSFPDLHGPGGLAVSVAAVLLDKIVGETVSFPEGGVVFIKGDRGNAAYMVRSGRVEIREGGRVVEAMTRGELFGEMALIDSEPRSASAVAVGSTELAVINA